MQLNRLIGNAKNMEDMYYWHHIFGDSFEKLRQIFLQKGYWQSIRSTQNPYPEIING